MCRRGGDEHPVEGVGRETLWGCPRWLGQSARYHTWRLFCASFTYFQVRGGSVRRVIHIDRFCELNRDSFQHGL